MTQKAKVWRKVSQSATGVKSYAEPIILPCRWEEKVSLARGDFGEERVVEHIVFVGGEASSEDLVALGEESPLEQAREVRAVERVPSLNGVEVLVRIVL